MGDGGQGEIFYSSSSRQYNSSPDHTAFISQSEGRRRRRDRRGPQERGHEIKGQKHEWVPPPREQEIKKKEFNSFSTFFFEVERESDVSVIRRNSNNWLVVAPDRSNVQGAGSGSIEGEGVS